MVDRAVPNLPARDFDATAAFYEGFGFKALYKDDGWMVLRRGDLQLEFFPHPDLDPAESWFSCCLRVADLDGLYETIKAAGVPEKSRGFPRLVPIETQDWGQRMGALLDPEGSLLRLIEDAG